MSAWFIDVEKNWMVDEPTGLSKQSFISGVVGFYDVDRALYPTKDKHKDWHKIQIVWDALKGQFSWETKAGVKWHLKPLLGKGGWENAKLSVSKDSVYFKEGYHSAKIEWVSHE